MNNRIVLILLLITFIPAGVSCSKTKLPDGMPQLYPCTVKIIQEGKPLAEAEILLKSADPNLERWAITGRTDANGTARIVTMGKYSGAPLGDYTVLLSKNETIYDQPPKEVHGEMVYGPSTSYFLISPDQGNEDKSPHKLTIESKTNQYEFDCGKKVRIKCPKETM
ncbi:MAG: hypothetical protein Q4G69_07250 [Planctomycetia bacterium]|nr:hypothetical protein [Planctomycetia bacterium]